MKFTKMQGLGNDFIIIDAHEELLPTDLSIWAKGLCHRHFGIGADGVMLVVPSERADIGMRILNSDGSEAEMCGNGIRCFARYVYEKKIVEKTLMTIETLAGIMVAEIIWCPDGEMQIKVDMGEPILQRHLIPMVGEGDRVVGEMITVGERLFEVTAISMGNPHCVIFVDDMAQTDLETWGPRLERSDYFPRKTNVEFVQVINEHEVRMRVWERGASITLACGTGACATAVACVLNGKTVRDITVHLDGGDLQIHWDALSQHVYMTGPAVVVYTGEVY